MTNVSTPVTVPSLPDDVAQGFIKKHNPIAWRFDADGREIPGINPDALRILEDISESTRRRVFIAKSFDQTFNYEELEFLGDAALRYSVSELIERRYRHITMAWRHNLRRRLLNRACLSKVALGLGLEDRIQVGPGCKVSQAVLEDVVEAIAGAISQELGYPALYKWTEATFGPMVEIYKTNMIETAEKGGIDPLKRSRPDNDEHIHSLPVSEDDGAEQAIAKHAKADLALYCQTKNHSLIYESVGVRRVDSQEIWTERVTVAGVHVAEGHATSKRRAQASAARTIINSGVFTDIGEFDGSNDPKRRRVEVVVPEAPTHDQKTDS